MLVAGDCDEKALVSRGGYNLGGGIFRAAERCANVRSKTRASEGECRRRRQLLLSSPLSALLLPPLSAVLSGLLSALLSALLSTLLSPLLSTLLSSLLLRLLSALL